MGVPKFYRWISERYPKINDIVSDSALLPEFDHLYLDMNGIIHGCTHPSDRDISDVISERDMMLGIMHYLDRIITQIVKPKVSVYMAIDGVAPRAKLNQQRSRRFRSAKDMQEATKDMPNPEPGEEKTQVFDSNCITPGTEFLASVSECIKYFIRKKIKEDPLWHNLKVVFSGHDVPGEGEHKIMQHIRDMKAQPHYQANTRHCIYGQDADLIMLGLVTHEPHFTILREVIDFNFARNNKNALKAVKKFTKESDFQLLHLSVLREYLRMDFCHEQPSVDLEHVIDDFVFMTFLVGNDFLPHMPALDIGDGAFDLLFKLYKDQRTAWGPGQYLTEAGNISDAERLEIFIAAIGKEETAILEKKEEDDAVYTKKRRKWDKRDGKEDGPSDAEIAAQEAEKQGDYLSMIEKMMSNASDAKFVDGWTPVTTPGQKDFKGRYYYEKMKMKPIDIDEHMALRKAYMEGLIWCLAYYYRGCISWGWFYPYHYGPMLSDLTNLPKLFSEIKFELGQPLTPFQQLMGCLPPASIVLVPPLYRKLMVDPESPIIEFYPVDFEVDMNGKRNPWEGVNLLPFIEANLLKGTIAKLCPDNQLSPVERKRNSLGRNYIYTFDLTCLDTIPSANPKIGLPDIVHCNSVVTDFEEPLQSGTSFMPKLLEGTQLPYPGFPSLNVLPIASFELNEIKLNCFGSPSKYPTMLIRLHEMPDLPPLEALAPNVIGKSVFINWPMMHEARVVAISNAKGEIRVGKDGKHKTRTFNNIETDRWSADSQAMFERYFIGNGVPGAGGVQIGDIRLRIKVLPLQGMKTNMTNGATKKLFGTTEADIPLQLALWQAPAPDPRFMERGPMTLQDRYPVNSNVVLTKGKHRGCTGVVVGVVDNKTVGVKVQIIPPELPFGLAIAHSVHESNISSVDAARILKLHPSLFGKITGSLLFEPGRFDLGLNLKSADGLCVVGYTRKKPETKKANGNGASAWAGGDTVLVVGSQKAEAEEQERVTWEYTPKAVRLVNAYRQKFPQLFNAITKQPNERKYDATAAFGPNGQAWLPVIREWLNSIETAKMPRTPVSTDSLSHEAVAAVEKASEVRNLALKKRGFPHETMLKIPGSALYREGSIGPTDVLQASDYNKNDAPELGDRIVNFCASGIPFGARGTVVGIHEATTTGCVEVVMDEEFIGGTTLQGACSNFRGKLCAWAHLLKVTPENSKSLVSKLVPKQSGQAGYENIIANVESDSLGGVKGGATAVSGGETSAVITKAKNGTPPSEPAKPKAWNQVAGGQQAKATPRKEQSSPQKARSEGMQKTNRPDSRHGSRPRAGSAGRGKQVLWKEARGPTEKSTGFKGPGKRGPSTGLNRWKKLAGAATKQAPAENTAAAKDAGQKSQELKALLGVTTSAPTPPTQSNAPAATSTAPSSNSAQLKALLGVGSPSPDQGIPLSQIPDPPMPPPEMMAPQNNTPASAADKLFALMKSKQPQGSQGYPQPLQQPSSFNFTYVEEGKEAPPQPPAPMPQQMMHMNPPMMHMQYPPPPNAYNYGYPAAPPAHMMPPPPMHYMHSPPAPPQNPGPSVEEFPPLGGPSVEEFPPLGAPAPPPKEKVTTTTKVEKSEKPVKNSLVPAAVAAKPKK